MHGFVSVLGLLFDLSVDFCHCQWWYFNSELKMIYIFRPMKSSSNLHNTNTFGNLTGPFADFYSAW